MLDWQRREDGVTSEAEIGTIELRVERDRESQPEYCWEARGFAETREEAFEEAERAAIAALSKSRPNVGLLTDLARLANDGKVHLVVEGKSNLPLLLSIIREAMISFEPKVKIPKRKGLSDIRRQELNVVKVRRA